MADPESRTAPDFTSARDHLRAALEALSTDPDVYDKSAVNSIWDDVLDATERLEKMIGIDGTP